MKKNCLIILLFINSLVAWSSYEEYECFGMWRVHPMKVLNTQENMKSQYVSFQLGNEDDWGGLAGRLAMSKEDSKGPRGFNYKSVESGTNFYFGEVHFNLKADFTNDIYEAYGPGLFHRYEIEVKVNGKESNFGSRNSLGGNSHLTGRSLSFSCKKNFLSEMIGMRCYSWYDIFKIDLDKFEKSQGSVYREGNFLLNENRPLTPSNLNNGNQMGINNIYAIECTPSDMVKTSDVTRGFRKEPHDTPIGAAKVKEGPESETSATGDE